MIFSSLRKKTVCGKVKQKKRNKSPCAYFFLILLKKNTFLSFFVISPCRCEKKMLSVSFGLFGGCCFIPGKPGSIKKTQRPPEGCRCAGGEKKVVKMDRCDFSRRRFSTLTLSLLPFSVISRLLISRVARYTPFSQRRPDEKWKQI